MAIERNPNDPYDPDRLEIPFAGSDTTTCAPVLQLDDDLQVDAELGQDPASSAKIALFALGIAVVLGVVFYGLNSSSTRTGDEAPTAPRPRALIAAGSRLRECVT